MHPLPPTDWARTIQMFCTNLGLIFYSSGLCTPRVAWWRGRTFALGSADTWTSSRGFPLPACLEGLRSQRLTLAGTVRWEKRKCKLDQQFATLKNKSHTWYWWISCLSAGVLKATDYRDRCLQVNLPMTDTRGSEDCLYLNIWVPHDSSGIMLTDREMTDCSFILVFFFHFKCTTQAVLVSSIPIW